MSAELPASPAGPNPEKPGNPGEHEAPAAPPSTADTSGLRAWLGRHRVLTDVLTMLGGTGGAQLITLLGYLVLARIYTDSDFGVLSIIVSIGSIGAVLAAGRYDPAIMLPDTDREAKQVVRLAVTINVIFSVIFLAGCVVATFTLSHVWPQVAPLLIFAALYVTVTSLSSIWTFWLNRLGEYRQISANRLFSAVAQVGLQIGAWLVGLGGAVGLIGGRILGVLAATVTLGYRARSSRVDVDKTQGARRRALLRYRKMPLLNGPSAIADAVRINGINLMIAAIFSTAMLGQFSFAWLIVQAPVALINGAVSQVYFRELTNTPRGQLRAMATSVTKRGALAGLVPFAALAALAPWLIPLIFGARWEMAGLIVTILCPWLYVNLVTSPVSNIFVVTETQQVSLGFSLVFAAVPLGLLGLAGWLGWGILATCGVLSAAMTVMLVVFIWLALHVAARFDMAAA